MRSRFARVQHAQVAIGASPQPFSEWPKACTTSKGMVPSWANGEVVAAAFGLRAPVLVSRNGDVAKGVLFDAGIHVLEGVCGVTAVQSMLGGGALGGGVHQVGLEHGLNLTVEDGIGVGCFVARTQVFDHFVRLEHIGANL